MQPSLFDSPQYKLLQKLPQELVDRVKFSSKGMAYVLEDNKKVTPLGCIYCYLQKPEQDSLGNPTINGVKMLTCEDEGVEVDIHPEAPEVMANLWFCPYCHKLDSSFLPRFF